VRNINLEAKYLPGVLNIVADMESRRSFQDRGDWQLNRMIFQKIWERWHPKIDLFALQWNAQLPEFVCWHPDPAAWMIDAFSLNWKYIKGYAFPPFNLIGHCIRKMRQDQAQLTLVCPYWPSQPWFPLLLETIVDVPRILPYREDLLLDANGEAHPLLTTNALCLIVWRLSGVASEARDFRTRLSTLYWPATDQPHTLATKPPGTSGQIGAIGTVTIPCRAL
jgi:hypothetical protein